MTLKEAFDNWSTAPRNMVLASKYRAGVNQVLMKKYGETELKEFTKEFATDIMRKSTVGRQLKVQAASALVYLLQWGGDHGHCPRPGFSFGEIVPVEKAQLVIEPVVISRTPDRMDPIKEEQDSSQDKKRRAGGRPPKAVAQIDPETLQVMKVWPVMAKVDAALNIGKGNVSRAVKKHQKAAGCYWCYADDSDAYIKDLQRIHPSRRAVKQVNKPADSLQDQRDQVAVLKRQYETFNEMRPVVEPPSFDQAQGTPVPERESAEVRQNVKSDPKAVPVPASNEKNKATLTLFTDQELFDELDRRGWVGCFTRTDIITIGK